MKRGNSGKLESERNQKGKRLKEFPDIEINTLTSGTKETRKVRAEVEDIFYYTDKGNMILADLPVDENPDYSEPYKNGKDLIEYFRKHKWEKIPEGIKSEINLKYNCFGFVFLDSEVWLDYQSSIKNIIDDEYEKINEDQIVKDCIVVFLDDKDVYQHIAKYTGGKWKSKMSIYSEMEGTLEEHQGNYKMKYFFKEINAKPSLLR